jgi:hypothetical protein
MDFHSHDGLLKLVALFRQNSRKLLENDLGGSTVQVHDCERRTLAFNQHLSLMLMNHSAFTARYTLHFMLKDALAIVARKCKAAADDVTKERAVDYVKEFCNMLVGSVVNGLLAQELFAVHSLPFAMQGYNDIFFASHEKDGLFDAYYLASEHGRIGVSLAISVSNAEGLEALKEVDTARIASASFSGTFDLL